MIDSITFEGWKTLFLTFLPFNLSIFIADVVAYVLIPGLILHFLIKHHKEKFSPIPQLGVWRSCGKVWLQIGVILCACIVVLFFLYSYFLAFSISTLKSQEMQYREYLHEKSGVVVKNETHKGFIEAIADKFQNKKADAQEQQQASTVKANNPSVDAAENNDPFADNIKETNQSAPKAPSKTITATEGTPAYSVVEFFYLNFRWLHHAFYTVLLLIAVGWFFLLPGYRMMNEKTKINVNVK